MGSRQLETWNDTCLPGLEKARPRLTAPPAPQALACLGAAGGVWGAGGLTGLSTAGESFLEQGSCSQTGGRVLS